MITLRCHQRSRYVVITVKRQASSVSPNPSEDVVAGLCDLALERVGGQSWLEVEVGRNGPE